MLSDISPLHQKRMIRHMEIVLCLRLNPRLVRLVSTILTKRMNERVRDRSTSCGHRNRKPLPADQPRQGDAMFRGCEYGHAFRSRTAALHLAYHTARLRWARLKRSSSSAGMRHRRHTRMAVMLRDEHNARMVFGATLSCSATSSVVRRFDKPAVVVFVLIGDSVFIRCMHFASS